MVCFYSWKMRHWEVKVLRRWIFLVNLLREIIKFQVHQIFKDSNPGISCSMSTVYVVIRKYKEQENEENDFTPSNLPVINKPESDVNLMDIVKNIVIAKAPERLAPEEVYRILQVCFYFFLVFIFNCFAVVIKCCYRSILIYRIYVLFNLCFVIRMSFSVCIIIFIHKLLFLNLKI